DITDKDITERAQLGVSYAFQQPVRFKGVAVRDLLELAAGGTINEENVCSILAKVGLCTKDYIDREVNASLSGGEIKRIEIASVLARKNSRLLIFDEPEAGIDLWSFSGLIDTFEELKKEKDKSLLVISHQERLLEIADEIAVIVDGKVRIAGPGKEIMPQLMEGEKSGSCPMGKEW
ncbi:MAG: ATP-binding cassette domain-containing protein, partial [Emergencia timonensis]